MEKTDLINKVLTDKNVVDYTEEEIKYCTTPIGNAVFNTKKHGRKRKDIRCSPNDRITCDICGREYNRSGKYNHDKTKIHQAYFQLNKKIANVLLNRE